MILYFSGTGNSLYAAKCLDSEIISIPQAIRQGRYAFHSDAIGIAAPIYGHEMPEMVKRFIAKADFDTDYLYVILTYGNRHASAVELAERVFETAGKKPAYIHTLLMVDNFLPAFDMEEQMKIDKNVDGQLAEIKKDIAARKREYEAVTDADREAHSSYLKTVGGRSEKVWADFNFTDSCIGCGICEKVCPAGCIYLENGRARRDDRNCQACYACVHACPKTAITVNPVLGFEEKNPEARYRCPGVTITEIIAANNQTA